jgi:hypothetical protein
VFDLTISHLTRTSPLVYHCIGQDVTEGDSNDVKGASSETDVTVTVEGESNDADIAVESESSVTFDGPQFIFGLELNTTSYGQIGRKALGVLLSTLLYDHMRLELPFKYDLKKVDIVDIQYLSLEPIRKRMVRVLQVQEKVKGHQFVVTAGTKFATEDVPTQEEISATVADSELAASDFWSSDNAALKSTTGVKLFQLSSVASALVAQQEPSADKSSILGGHSTLIFVFLGMALVVLLVGAAFYRKTRSSVKIDDTEKKLEVALQVLDTKKQLKLRDTEKNLAQMRDGVLLVVSESESDDSLAPERGLAADGFACVSAETLVNEIVDEMAEEDGFSCALSLAAEDAWKHRTYNTDIDTVVDDFVEGRVPKMIPKQVAKKRVAKRGPQLMMMKPNGRHKAKQGGIKKTETNDITDDSFVAHSYSEDESFSMKPNGRHKAKQGGIKKTETNDITDDSFVAHSYSEDESFSMFSVESEQNHCEGFDCGMSLAR